MNTKVMIILPWKLEVLIANFTWMSRCFLRMRLGQVLNQKWRVREGLGTQVTQTTTFGCRVNSNLDQTRPDWGRYKWRSIGLGFLNPQPQLRHKDITTFYMQFENRLTRHRDWGKRGCYFGITGVVRSICYQFRAPRNLRIDINLTSK